jgi:hypothetical protein
MVRRALLTAALMLCAPAVADVVTVSQTVTSEDNRTLNVNGPFFIPRDWTLDHDYRRGAWQDWGWTHDMTGLKPVDAIGIASATLKVQAWDVAGEWGWDGTQFVWCPEDDRIYALRTSGGTLVSFIRDGETLMNPYKVQATLIGSLAETGMYLFGPTTLTISDPGVLAEIWDNDALDIFMNIDALACPYCGHQVTLIYAMLTVDYIVPHTAWEPNMPVYQFWSPRSGENFWTANEREKNKLLTIYPPSIWTYEGIAHYTYHDKRDDSVFPVYRFWSRKTSSHFYTMKESEKDKLMAFCSRDMAVSTGIPGTWIYEGIAFYAQMEGRQAKGAIPVYRFWSGSLRRHCFTTNEVEKQEMERQPGVWQDEGIAWYAYQ